MRRLSFLLVLVSCWVGLATKMALAQEDKLPDGAIATGSPAPRAGAWKEKYLKHPDGFWIHYYELGSQGPPVVLLHGLGSTGFANWINVGIAPALAETNRVYVPDMRYAGRAAGAPAVPGGGMNNNANAKDVLFFMDALKIDKAHIGGYSMGGGTTASLMQQAPQRFLTAHFGGAGPRETNEFIGLVIPDPRPAGDAGGRGRGGRGARGAAPTGAPADSKAAAAPGKAAPAADGKAGPPANANAGPPANAKAGPPAGRGQGAALYAGGGPPTTYTGDLSKIDFPVLSVTGEFDAPNYVTHRFYRELKDFHRVILPGKQHIGAASDPKYTQALRAFIVGNNSK